MEEKEIKPLYLPINFKIEEESLQELSTQLEKKIMESFKKSQEMVAPSWGEAFRKQFGSLGSLFSTVLTKAQEGFNFLGLSQNLKKKVVEGFEGAQGKISSLLSDSIGSLGSAFSQMVSKGIQGGLSGGVNLVGSLFKGVFSSTPLVGSLVSGLGSLFNGIIDTFGGISPERQREIDKTYEEQNKKIEEVFSREIQMREENLSHLNKQLSAFTKAFESGQMTAEEYYKASGAIGGEIQKEQLESAKASKLQKLMSEELTKKKAVDEEKSKWFPDQKKLNLLQKEIQELKNRQTVVQNARSLTEVNMARHGALQRVDRPTLFMAGEAGAELVAIKPLKATIDPALASLGGQGGMEQIFNIQISGFVGNEAQLGAELVKVIQSAIRVSGEKEFRR